MKVGDIVRNVMTVRNNPVVNESRGWKPVDRGNLGIVLAVRQTDLNASYRADGKGDVYVDVMLSVNGESVRCGNHLANTFEVVV
jgi:hypothetical protein